MNDRELLELAAKAAGIKIVGENNDGLCAEAFGCAVYYWRPLTDDGDAFRLAVTLNIAFTPFKAYAAAQKAGHQMVTEPIGGSLLVATRRAIVRAAAEIGRNMP